MRLILREGGIDDNLDGKPPRAVVGIVTTNLSFGMVIGKALENFDGPESGKIEVLVNVK